MNCSQTLEYKVVKTAYRYRRFQKNAYVIVGCEFQQYKGISCNKSYLTEKEMRNLFVKKLTSKLISLGNLAQKRGPNYLGNCAEVHSANKVLTQIITSELTNYHFQMHIDRELYK